MDNLPVNSFRTFSIALQIAFWAVLFSIVLYVSVSATDVSRAVERIVLVFTCHLVTFYTCYSFIVPKYFEKKNYTGSFLSILVLFVVLTPLRLLIERHFAGAGFFTFNHQKKNGVLFSLILFSEVAVAAFACLVKLAASSFIDKQKMESMRSMHLESELRFLKAQMSPHFLFNTINNIYSLTLVKSDKAPKFLLKLSGLLRYLLYECDRKVTYKQEEEALQTYAQLFQLRYDEALNLHAESSVQQSEKLIEPMLLIPVLENAFKYSGLGINPDAYVKLVISEKEGKLLAVCENSIDTGRINDQPGGIGLTNISKRLAMAYPNEHEFSFSDTNNVFIIKLTLPLL